jgi:hypothetical protein
MRRLLGLLGAAMLITSCTYDNSKVPEITRYENDSELMINICNKFANDEGDVEKLHNAAVATQSARVISCSDFNGECTLYGECLNLVIKASKSSSISFSDRKKLKDKANELKQAIRDGKVKIRQQSNPLHR